MSKRDLWKRPLALISHYRSALMGAAALIIMLHHCWIPLNLGIRVLAEAEKSFLSVGYIGVEIFLFLSGMGLTYSIDKYEHVGQFYMRRIRRLVFPVLFAGLIYKWRACWSAKTFFLWASGITFVTESIDVFLWYVFAALILYAVFPLYDRFLKRSKNETVFVLNSIMLWLIFSLAVRHSLREDLWLFVNRIPVFLMGILAGRLCRSREIRFEAAHWSSVICAFVLSFWLTRLAIKGQFVMLPEMMYSIPAAALAITLMLLLSLLFEAMDALGGLAGGAARWMIAGLQKVGAFSLELYCLHQWLQGEIFRYLEGCLSYTQINLLSIPVNILAAWLLYCLNNAFWKGIDRGAAAVKRKKRQSQ